MKKTSKMKKSENLFRKAEFDSAKYVKDVYLDYGKAYISAKVKSIDEIISKYSIKDYEWINPEFADYIEQNAYYIPEVYRVVIEINGKFTEEEQAVIEETIKDYTGLKLGDAQKKVKANTIKSLGLLIFGLISAIFFVIASHFNISDSMFDMISLLVWFALWEFMGLVVFDRAELNRERMNAAQLATCQIIFNEED